MFRLIFIPIFILIFLSTTLFSQVDTDTSDSGDEVSLSISDTVMSDLPDSVNDEILNSLNVEQPDNISSKSLEKNDSLKNSGKFLLNSDKSLAKSTIDTSAVIYGWILDRNYVSPEKFDIDTSLVGFQNYNPVFKKYILPATLGNNSSAYLPLCYFDRDYNEDLLFLTSYKALFSTYDNTYYINTKKPFSHLYYFSGADKPNREENIEIYHTQNVNSRFNFGFNLKVLSDKGLYKYLMVKNKNFKAFTSYNGHRYTLHSTFNVNRYQVEESGGVIDSLFENVPQTYSKLYDVNFSGETNSPYSADVTNKVRYMDGLISQKIKLFTIGNKTDSSKTYRNIAEPSISHIFTYRRVSKMYEESAGSSPAIPIYERIYTNPQETYDSIAQLKVTNRLQLDFNTKLRGKVSAGFFVAAGHEYNKFTYYSLLDSSIIDNSDDSPDFDTASDGSYLYYSSNGNTYRYDIFVDRNGDTLFDINKNVSLSNLYLDGGIYGKFWTYFQSSFSARLYFAGYKAEETRIDGNLVSRATIFSKSYLFSIQGALENLKPSYQLNNYYSNNYIWEDKNFNFINRVFLSSKIASPSNKFELSANYALLRNHIYFSNDGPVSYNTTMNLLALSLARDIVFWKIHFYNRVIYQIPDNKLIIDMPTVLLYSSAYFDHTWNFKLTEGKIRTMLGVDVRYDTKYNGYSYNPSWALFYQENTNEIGNYPFIDIWFNIRLKRTRFFAKFEHFNSTLWNRRDYYYAVSYPAKISTFKYGISWTFYD